MKFKDRIKYAVKALRGEPFPAICPSPMQNITRSNVETIVATAEPHQEWIVSHDEMMRFISIHLAQMIGRSMYEHGLMKVSQVGNVYRAEANVVVPPKESERWDVR